MLASPAVGQSFAVRQCLPFPTANERAIREHFNERVAGMGITGGGWLVERWENTETGTWTLTLRSPDGLLCMLALGEDWRTKEPVEPEPESMAL